MIESRIAKIVIVGSLAIFALLVTFDNLTDYNTNYEFVRHVLSMDTTFSGQRTAVPSGDLTGLVSGSLRADHSGRRV